MTSPKWRKDERKISPPHLLHSVRYSVFDFFLARGLAPEGFATAVFAPTILLSAVFASAVLFPSILFLLMRASGIA